MSFLGNNFPAANSYEQLSYGYDALGRRVVKDVAGESAEIMVYDDEDVVKAEAGGVVEKRFVHGAGIDDYVAMVRPDGLPEAGTYNYHADGLGSVTALSDNSDAALQASYEYQPFGDAKKLSGTGIEQFNPYGYTGRELDDETGLMYYRMRFLSPEQRRFIKEDILSGDSTYLKNYVNLYLYVDNNPLLFIDPSGLQGMQGGATGLLDGANTYRPSVSARAMPEISDKFRRKLADMCINFDCESHCTEKVFGYAARWKLVGRAMVGRVSLSGFLSASLTFEGKEYPRSHFKSRKEYTSYTKRIKWFNKWMNRGPFMKYFSKGIPLAGWSLTAAFFWEDLKINANSAYTNCLEECYNMINNLFQGG